MNLKIFFFTILVNISSIYSIKVFSQSIDLFSTILSVPSISEIHREEAARTGITSIFVKITGDSNVLKTYPKLISYSKNATNYLSSFSYIEDSNHSFNKKNHLSIKLNFQPEEIKQILIDAQAPFWGSKRPEILIWFINQSGAIKSFSQVDDFDFINNLYEHIQFLGLPIVEPILDLSEISILTEEKNWDEIYEDVYSESNKYNADIIYIIQFSEKIDGGWLLLSLKKDYKDIIIESYIGDDILNFLKMHFTNLASNLAKNFSIPSYNISTLDHHIIKISNINTYTRFRNLIMEMSDVSALESIKVKKINGGVIYFSVPSNIPIQKLITIISLNKNLIKNDIDLQNIQDDRFDLSYKWMGK